MMGRVLLATFLVALSMTSAATALAAPSIPCEGPAPIAERDEQTCGCEDVSGCPYDSDHPCLEDKLICRDEACGEIFLDEENLISRRCAGVGAVDATNLPNVLVIVSDDANWAHLGEVANRVTGEQYSLWSGYYQNLACHGGFTPGKGCGDDSHCFGLGSCREWTRRCDGGADDGNPCKIDEDCAGAATCEPCGAGECRANPMHTPNLDSLAGTGAFFPVAHTTAARCAPSIVSIMTGRYGKNFERRGTRISSKSLPRMLSDTHCSISVGKVWSGKFDQSQHCYDCCCEEAGCCDDVKHCPSSCNPRVCCGDPRIGFHYSVQRDYNLSFRSIGRLKHTLEKAACLVREVNQEGKASFMWMLPYVPHAPINPPEPLAECYRSVGREGRKRIDDTSDSLPQKGRLAQISWLDCTIGAYLDFLKTTPDTRFCPHPEGHTAEAHECGPCMRECDPSVQDPCGEGIPCVDGRCQSDVPCLIDTTVILTINDNGRALGEAKGHYSENGYRNPIIMSYGGLGSYEGSALDDMPARVGPRIFSDKSANAVDFVPTVLDYAGCDFAGCGEVEEPCVDGPCPGHLGRSLRSLVEDPSGVAWRSLLFGHRVTNNIKISGSNGHYARATPVVAEGVPGTTGSGACHVDQDCSDQGWDAFGLDRCVNGVCTRECGSDDDCADVSVAEGPVRCISGSCATGAACKLYHKPKGASCNQRLFNLVLDADERVNLIEASESNLDLADPFRACYDSEEGSRGHAVYQNMTCELVRWCLQDCGGDQSIGCHNCCVESCDECVEVPCSCLTDGTCVDIKGTCFDCRKSCEDDQDCANLAVPCDTQAGKCVSCQSGGCQSP